MQEIIITPFKGCKLAVKGIYTKGEPEVNYASQFEIEKIECLEKDIYDLLEWGSSTNVDYKFIIEEMCINEIELNKNL